MRSELINEVLDPIAESRRYVDNARQTLKQNGQLNIETRRYDDAKYVKAAGNYLWLAVLMALDAVFHVKKNKASKRVDVDDYKKAVAQRDRKLSDWVNDAYNVLHLYMNYDGVQAKDTVDSGFRLANDIIDRCATMLPGGGER